MRRNGVLHAWLAGLLILACIPNTFAEIFTSLVELEDLLVTEAVFLQILDTYITQQQARINTLKMKSEQYHKQNQIASESISEYLSNPVNAYLLVKRLVYDWKNIETLMDDQIFRDVMQNITTIKHFHKVPNEEDLAGAAIGLFRIQHTYKIDTASLANSELVGVRYPTKLSATECFELGYQSYVNQDYYHSALWMTEALVRHDKEETNTNKVGKWDILEYLAYSHYLLGDIPAALNNTYDLLNLIPDHGNALINLEYFRSIAQTGITQEYIPPAKEDEDVLSDTLRESYEKTCRNEISPPVNITSKLVCRYVHYNNPFLRLAPLKVEEAYLKPRILLYRQVLYDSEIDVIKKMAKPRLQRATVPHRDTGKMIEVQYRISKSAWLTDAESEIIAKISRRVEDMTGLSLKTAEHLQVVNYGIGGQYEPHYDFARKEELGYLHFVETGNRIATVLFYLNDVLQGGATAFPYLKLGIWPEKGSAAFWLNLHSDGKGDYKTSHAACPVLAGYKWIASKWLHEFGQEFRRPCDLTPSEEDDLRL